MLVDATGVDPAVWDTRVARYCRSERSARMRRATLLLRPMKISRLTGTAASPMMARPKASELDVMAAMRAKTAVAPYAIPVMRSWAAVSFATSVSRFFTTSLTVD